MTVFIFTIKGKDEVRGRYVKQFLTKWMKLGEEKPLWRVLAKALLTKIEANIKSFFIE